MNEAGRLARDRMRNVDKTNVGKVLSSGIYWTRAFVREFLERIDVLLLEDPPGAYEFGRIAAELVRFTRSLGRADGFTSEVEAQSWHARAYAACGSACRVTGKLDEAEQAFEQAYRLMGADGLGSQPENARVNSHAQAEVHRRYAALLALGHDPETLSIIDWAMEGYQQAGQRGGLADALQLRGAYMIVVEQKSGFLELSKALLLVNMASQKGRRRASGILQNMLLSVARLDSTLEECHQAVVAITKLKRSTARSRPSIARAKLYWVEGLLLRKIGYTFEAAGQLKQGRQYFLKLGDPFEFALISLDLVLLYLASSDHKSAKSLAYETESLLRSELQSEPKLLKALLPWRQQEPSLKGIKTIAHRLRRMQSSFPPSTLRQGDYT